MMGLIKDRGRGQYLSPGAFIGILVWLGCLQRIQGNGRFGYFSQANSSQVLLPRTVWDVLRNNKQTEFSFRTCSDGELLYQSGAGGDLLKLHLLNGTLEFQWQVNSQSDNVSVASSFNKNQWFNVNVHRLLGNLYLNVSRGGRVFFSEIISNSTFRTYLSSLDLTGSSGLYVGRDFTGCFMEGVNVIFTNNVNIQSENVIWSDQSCTQSDNTCANIANGDKYDCYSQPCFQGTCVDGQNNYTCVCPHLYNGTQCENDLSVFGCDVEPCINGGTCIRLNGTSTGSRNYQCECVNGFVGINCESDVNECASVPCLHGTLCTDKVGSYQCNCTGSGFNGTNCDDDIDECADTTVCGVTGNCFNNQGSYTCQCQTGYFGPACQDVDECISNPCQNNATCENAVDAFTCTCVQGFTGDQCETDIDECEMVTCNGSHSICKDLINGYECVCAPGYSGTPGSCADIDECLSSPCKNSATCTNLENDYSCTCRLGFTDKNCQTNIDECQSGPCLNQSTCVDGVNSYTCFCVDGFEGKNCGTNINECELYQEPCFNGGTCNDMVNDFNCTCADGFMGDRCTTNINECESNPCGINSVQCINGPGIFTCGCKPGFTGQVCDKNIDECLSQPCFNAGTCNDTVNGYICDCDNGWMGTNCNIVYDACSPEFGNCKNGANCSSTPPSHVFNCSCVSGYTGNQCETNIDDCLPDACTAPKVCHDELNGYTCKCPNGFEGSNCTTDIDECQSNPCQNEATCAQNLGFYTCQCVSKIAYVPETNGNRSFLTGYEGVNCELDINECDIQPSICLNHGICQNEPGGFQCLCGRDIGGTYFTGSHCEIRTSYCYIAEDVKNDQPACKNNGTCKGIIGNYTCSCIPGFTGRRCEINIDECKSSPCQFDGTCIDGINGYTCDCIPGITGVNCETNINECGSNPCLNFGQCTDEINRYNCNCSDTGFKGDNCQIEIDECESNPCFHGSTCVDKIKDYDCMCYTGYTGKNCEMDINECLSTPCQFNSSCHEKSNQTLYDIDYPGFQNLTFSYAEAAGYLCECVPGSEGINCEINIDDCMNDSCSYHGNCTDLLNNVTCGCFPGYEGYICETEINECDRYLPCLHGSTCIDKIADYDCSCAKEYNAKIYAGKNCSFELTACKNNLCVNGDCEPYLVDEANKLQKYRCLCNQGFTGQFCNISTTVSFTAGSSIGANVNSVTNTKVTLLFRTTLTHSVLIAWPDSQSNDIFIAVELVDGNICMFYSSYSSKLCIINKHFNNAEWQTLHVQVSSSSVQLTVSSALCQPASDCILTTPIIIASPSQSVQFGNLQGTNLIADGPFGTQFVGCMEDITVNGVRLTLLNMDPKISYTSLTLGCPRTEQCFILTCNLKGACLDLWNDHRCECYRPNLGKTCNTEHTAATFAYNNTESSATFTLPQDLVSQLETTINLSFFMRTRQTHGLMIFFGSNTNYVTAGLESGHVEVRINLCSIHRKVITENDTYANGERHLIQLHRNGSNFELDVDGVRQYDTSDIASDCQFSASRLHLGGKTTVGNSRKRRRAVVINDDPNLGDFNSLANFKGTIQDLQLNDKSLEFYPLADPSLNPLPSVNVTSSTGLTESEVTDPTCDMISPCENNSTCSDVFFNDYRCQCLLGYRGKNCSDLDFCVTGQCPDGTTCQSLLDGFECRSNSTFNGRNSKAIYKHNLPDTKQITDFSFKFRTLARNGKMLHIGTSDRYYRVQLTGSYLIIAYRLDEMKEQTVTAMYDVSDSIWYEAEIKEETSQVTLTLKNNQNLILVNISSQKSVSGDNLSSILSDSSMAVTIGIDEPFNSRRPFYQGCFGEIRIAGILLPFYYDDEFINNTSKERFLLQLTSGNFEHGCKAGDSCLFSQCKFNSQCVDDYYSYTCSCRIGYAGRWCETLMDQCQLGDECLHGGDCYSGLNSSMCQCPVGFIGDRCETDVNECETSGSNCQNGGTCQNENGTFSCACPADTLGDFCEANMTQTCNDNPCVHGSCSSLNTTDSSNNLIETFNCSCDIGYHGYKCSNEVDNCAGLPCKNGATCISAVGTTDYNCTCPPGYTGITCEDNIDDCPTDVCKNDGVCVDGLNTYACNCTPSLYYKGETCEVDIDECKEQQPCQNGGLCIDLDGQGFNCSCWDTGYEGIYCEKDVDECTFNYPCRNGAICTNLDGDYSCNCTEGYEEKDCQTPNCSDINCTIGSCRITDQQWGCDCPDFYEGKYCEIKGLCADKPCNQSNTLLCEQNSTFSFDCVCKTGWEGDTCDADVDECQAVNCQNGATCVNLPGLYQCDCADGYTGTLCEADINECEPQPCKNGGICANLIGNFECNCTGTGYSNETCEEDTDECLDSPCYNGGVCVNTDGSYRCNCPAEFDGQDCEVKARSSMDDDQDLTWYIVGPAVAVFLILIVIGIVCFVNCVRKKRATRGAYSPSRQEVTGSRVELGNVMKKPPLERLI